MVLFFSLDVAPMKKDTPNQHVMKSCVNSLRFQAARRSQTANAHSPTHNHAARQAGNAVTQQVDQCRWRPE